MDIKTKADGPAICSFVVEGAPIIYFGELFYDAEDTTREKLIFKKALVRVLDPKQNTADWVKVPTSGKDSVVYIDTKVIRGILVKNIDSEYLNEYREASLKLYSNLTLA